MAPKNRTAIIYDFDGTLSPGAMQQHSLLPEMGYIEHGNFWREVKEINKIADGDEILTYMQHMLALEGDKLTKSRLRIHGAQLPYFDGVESWLDRITDYGSSLDLDIEHYVISSGLHEMIDGSIISKYFKHIFASKFYWDGETAKWPAVAINYTGKTQYLFRINKGVLNNYDDRSVNRWIPMDERPIPFQRMIFLGDGDTDIPAMKMLRYQGGIPIAVFDPVRFGDKDGTDFGKVYNLISEERASYVCPADYRTGQQLDATVKGVLGRIARDCGYRP